MAKFIVFAGKKQSGKTTAANFVYDKLRSVGRYAYVTSFATPIKDLCVDVLGLDKKQVYGSDEQKDSATSVMWDRMPREIRQRYGIKTGKSYTDWLDISTYEEKLPRKGPMTAREVMQVFGTDIMRDYFDKDIWAKVPFRKYDDKKYAYIIIDDCRFPNEADIALSNGATLIKLDRCKETTDKHLSELALDDYSKYTYSIVGDISVQELKDRVYDILIKEGVLDEPQK